MLPRFLAHFYAIFLYFVQTNIGLPQKVIKLLFFCFSSAIVRSTEKFIF
jgi:hypothetical protein